MRDDDNFTEVIYTTAVTPETVAIYGDSPTPDKFKRKGTFIRQHRIHRAAPE